MSCNAFFCIALYCFCLIFIVFFPFWVYNYKWAAFFVDSKDRQTTWRKKASSELIGCVCVYVCVLQQYGSDASHPGAQGGHCGSLSAWGELCPNKFTLTLMLWLGSDSPSPIGLSVWLSLSLSLSLSLWVKTGLPLELDSLGQLCL